MLPFTFEKNIPCGGKRGGSSSATAVAANEIDFFSDRSANHFFFNPNNVVC
jgi:hypothetical protein